MCDDCGRTHLLKECPLYKQLQAQALLPSITKILAEREDQPTKHSYIRITLVSKETIVFILANLDSKTNQSVLSYEVWESLGKPTLTSLASGDKKCLGSIILKVRIQEQPMYCTFHVANLNERAEDATLGWFWMCRTDYQVDESVNTYSVKVNSVTLTGEMCTKEPKKVQEVLPLWEASSKAMANPKAEIKSSTKKVTFKEPVKTVVTTTTKDHSKQADIQVEKSFQPLQGYGRGESQCSARSNQGAKLSPLPNPSTSKSLTYQDKGKAKVESSALPQCPHNLNNIIKESSASSSSATKGLPKIESHTKRQGKVYQPKYPSLRAQQRRQSQQVLVPKQMLNARRLCQGDEHKWVERQATRTMHSSGWISTQRSLDSQGYNQGNRELWLPKPELTAYKMPSMTDLPTRVAQKQPQRTQQQRRKKRKSKPRRRPPTIGQPNPQQKGMSKHGSLRKP